MTLSQLFKAAIKHLPKDEFLCHAINSAIQEECEKNSTDVIAREGLHRLGIRARSIVMNLLDGYVSLDGWMANHKEVRVAYYSYLPEQRNKMMLKTRKAWARHLAKQYKGVK